MDSARVALADAESFAFEMNIVMSVETGGLTIDIPMTYAGDFQAPNSSAADLTIAIPLLSVESKVVSLGDTSYVFDPSSRQWNIVQGQSPFFAGPDVFLGSTSDELSDLLLTGQQLLDGVDTYVISGKLPNGEIGGAGGDFDFVYWIGIEDGLLRQVEADGELNLGDGATLIGNINAETGSAKITAKFFDFGKEVDITAPMLEALPPGSGQQSGGAASQAEPPPMILNPNADYAATILMATGDEIVIQLYASLAPITVSNFVTLAQEGFYDGVTFHRVIEGFMAQTGDPTGTGSGGPNYRFDNEFHPSLRHDSEGVVSMANSGVQGGRGTNGSQFFITYGETPWLDGFNSDGTLKNCAAPGNSCHSVFGRVIQGMDLVRGIAPRDPQTANSPGEVIETIRIITELRSGSAAPPIPAPAPTALPPPATSMGDLITPRYIHNATVLDDGRVLVTGGVAGNIVTAEVEAYDSAANTWLRMDQMGGPRAFHVAAKLADGRVLVAGGSAESANQFVSTAEVFDPATGSWTQVSSMSSPRGSLGAVLLGDGRVLVAGGVNSNGISTNVVEIFDPKTGNWQQAASLIEAAGDLSTVLMTDGRVLAMGGTMADGQATALAEIYDPTTDVWSLTGPLNDARSAQEAVVLSDGRVLVVGGASDPSGVLSSAEIYDPKTGTWTPTGDMTGPRAGHSLTLLSGGRVLAAGGLNSVPEPQSTTEIFDPSTDTWSATPDLSGTRILHTATLLDDGRVLLTGGIGGPQNGPIASIEIIEP